MSKVLKIQSNYRKHLTNKKLKSSSFLQKNQNILKPKEINIIIKKGKRNKPQEAKVEKKEEKIVKKNNNILNKKPKNKISRFQTLVFPISQINGKIII